MNRVSPLVGAVLLTAPFVSADALVGYWKMEPTNGPVVVDSAGTGSVDDEAAWVGTPEYAPAPFGSGVMLDGSQYLRIVHSADVNRAGKDTTVSAWFRVTAWDTPWQCLLAKGEGNRYRISRRGSSETELAGSGGTGNIFGGSVNDGEWHHAAMVTDHGSETRFYLDGVRVATGGGAVLDDTAADLLIGANPESATLRRWKGGIDEVGLFDEALGDAAVATLHALATQPDYRYDLGTFDALLSHYALGAGGGVHQIGRHGWSYAAEDPEDGRAFFALGEDGSGLAVLESAIHSFEAEPAFISAGENTVLKWRTSGLQNLLMERNGVGPVTLGPGRTGEWTVSPSVTTTYVLRGRGPEGEVEAEVVVYVDEQPQVTFTAEDLFIVPGQKAVLTWTSRGAESLTINRSVGEVLPLTGQDGSGRIEVSVEQTATYILTATNPLGTVRKPVRINVGELPVVEAFVADKEEIVPGEAVNFSWRLTGANSARISEVGGISKVGGTKAHVPLGTATFELIAENPFGEARASVSIAVAKLVGVDGSGWTVLHRTSQGTIDSLEDADALLDGQNVAESAQAENVLAINFGPGEVGEFGGDSPPPLGDAHDDFAVRATATLIVNFAGEYVFGINNDEGGRLRIDGQDVIVDDALHTPRTSNGTMELDPGTYPIEYVYFDRTEGQAGEVFVVGPAGTNELLEPTEAVTGLVSQDLVINEFMADNTQRLDKDGDSSDWIELYNGTGETINLKGYYLTDDPTVPNKYALPEMELLDRRYLLVWASGKDTILAGTEVHANFKLNNSGEYLALYKDNGRGGFQVLTEFGPAYPPQREDVSYGFWASSTTEGFMTKPSPRSINRAGVLGFLGDTRFNVDRGFFEEPFLLEITTDHPAAVIHYTLNGAAPTATTGEVYTGPIEISETTVVRAAASLHRYEPTNIDTQTYIFPKDVVKQSPAHAFRLGFPSGSVNGQQYQYGMSRQPPAHLVESALKAIPTVSLAVDQRDFSAPSTGIYSNAGSRGRGWERPASFELLNEKGQGRGQVQQNCGLRVRGGFSRSRNNPKHAFRLFFRGEYEGDLEYPMFQDEGANRFENLDLRTSQNYSWAFQNNNQNTFLREVHGRDAQREMGQPYTRSRYYHLYINGVYWGLYMSQERAENSYGETYLGGDKDHYDVVKSAGSAAGYTTEATDGSLFGAWRDLHQKVRALRQNPNNNAAYFAMQGLAPDGVSPHPNPEGNPVLLDVDNLIDYMLAIYYTGNYDAPLSTFLRGASNNWFAMRDQNGTHGFQFFVHDGEHSMGTGSNSNNRVGPWSTGGNYAGQISDLSRSNPQYLHEDLAFNAEYRMRFADRVQKHFFNGGAFTPDAALNRVTTRSNQIRVAINAELARWGSGFSYNTWTDARQDIENFIRAGVDGRTSGEGRTSYILNLLRNYFHSGSKPLFPSAKAPEFNVAGGEVPKGFVLRITDPNLSGAIYYTTDGMDPRAPGGRASASAKRATLPFILSQSGPVRARVLHAGNWSPLVEADFIVGVGGSAQSLAISEIHYHPATTPEDTFDDEDQYEFVEIVNVATDTTIELTGVIFDNGIGFDFTNSDVTQLGPGARVLVVRNREAFLERYPEVAPELIAGEFSGALDNGGERLTLRAADGEVIADFRYNDNVPWPTPPDGEGYSLVLNDVFANLDPSVAPHWRSHATLHGNPGGVDGIDYQQWALEHLVPGDFTSDSDGDGTSDFFEYVFASDPQDAESNRRLTMEVRGFQVDGRFANYLSMTVPLNLQAADVELVPEFSTDLETWTNAADAFVLEEIQHQGDGTALLRWRTRLPTDDPEQRHSFLRLRANRR